jgi:chemotaxis protein methyltransferase CheR
MLDNESFMKFADAIRRKLNFDMSGYKLERMKRRVDFLMRKYSFDNYDDYLKILDDDPSKQKEFFDRITINVTEFFRNPDKWEKFKEYIEKEMKTTPRGTFWSAGCASGEEPYSIAIMLEEMHASPLSYKVLASDLDPNILEVAKKGIYDKRALVNIKDALRDKYFKKLEDGRFQIIDKIKNRVTFRRQNLLADPFEKNLMAILCRNVVIYFEMEAKEKLYQKFADALRPGGILFVGGTERIFNSRKMGLEPVEPFFYKKVINVN